MTDNNQRIAELERELDNASKWIKKQEMLHQLSQEQNRDFVTSLQGELTSVRYDYAALVDRILDEHPDCECTYDDTGVPDTCLRCYTKDPHPGQDVLRELGDLRRLAETNNEERKQIHAKLAACDCVCVDELVAKLAAERQRADALQVALAAERAKVERLEKGIAAVQSLIAESGVVDCLHLNGESAPDAAER